MAKIVIIGAGIGGIPMAYELKTLAHNGHEIIVINKGNKFNFTPSNPWLAVNWKKRSEIDITVTDYLEKNGIKFICTGVKKLHPDKNIIQLFDETTIEYDYLIIASGPKLAFEEIEGLGPNFYSNSVCQAEHAENAGLNWSKFLNSPGSLIVGAVQGASCFGPAYETALIMDTDLRKHKVRDKSIMTFITPEPYLGHLGLGGVGDSTQSLKEEFIKRNINWICNARITKLTAESIFIEEYDSQGKIKQPHILKNDYSMFIPPFLGIEAFHGIDGLVNQRGFIIVDKYQNNPKYSNIYAIGVSVAIPPVETTVVPTGTPKTGFMIESMVLAVANNLKSILNGGSNYSEPTLNAVCFADFGDGGSAFVAIPQFKPRTHDAFYTGQIVHYAKAAFEKYFIYKVRHGLSETFYEKYIMDLINIKKVKN